MRGDWAISKHRRYYSSRIGVNGTAWIHVVGRGIMWTVYSRIFMISPQGVGKEILHGKDYSEFV